MALTAVLRVFGWATVLFAFCMLAPAGLSVYYDEVGMPSLFAITMLLTLTFGAALTLAATGGRDHRPGRRETFLLAVLIWTWLPVFGAIPFHITAGPVDAYFEAMSGLTTTGYSVFPAPETLPRSLVFWRAELQWIGGIATIMLSVVLLGLFGLGGLEVYRSAIPLSDQDSLIARLKDTLQAIWWVYLTATGICAILLWQTGLGPFHAICYAMSTVSTGGFVTTGDGVNALGASSRGVLVAFMLFSALNFTLHWAGFHGRFRGYRDDPEVIAFAGIYIVSALLVFAVIHAATDGAFGDNLGRALFWTASVASTTGFVAVSGDEFGADGWPPALSVLLLTLMMVGAAAGSTAGGCKVIRFVLMTRQAGIELSRLVFPNAVDNFTYGGHRVDHSVLRSAWNFLILFMISVSLLAVIISLGGHDLTMALALSAGALANAGPAAHYVTGAAVAMDGLDVVTKSGIVVGMLAGRLELLALIGLFAPSFWGR